MGIATGKAVKTAKPAIRGTRNSTSTLKSTFAPDSRLCQTDLEIVSAVLGPGNKARPAVAATKSRSFEA